MKKRIFCFILAILLVFSAAGTVLAADSQENSDSTRAAEESMGSGSGNNGISNPDMSEIDSATLMLARLQIELAEANRQQALDIIEQIKTIQDKQKQVAAFIAKARECQNKAKNDDRATEMPVDMAEFMKANGLSYDTTGNDLKMNKDEWEYNIKSLTDYQEQLGGEMQRLMVSAQDFMGQYNAYLQEANSAISNSNQMPIELARGQSMYGDSEVGLAVTGLVVGLVLGCVITLAVQKARGKKDKA